jgi:hypothetical protein
VIADAAAGFGMPVLLVEGDSHVYKEDRASSTGIRRTTSSPRRRT